MCSDTTTALYAWNTINGAGLNVIADPLPVSSALPNSLQLTIPEGASGPIGFGNEGYYGPWSPPVACPKPISGIQINSGWTYNASFYYKFPVTSSFKGAATIALQSAEGQVYASASVSLIGSQTTWSKVFVNLRPMSSPMSTANNFTVTLNAAEAAGETIDFAMFSLFPPTFKGRANGLRIDIATVRDNLGGSVVIIPLTT
jgi:alpha-N-arabinofuranosidase